MSSQSSQTKTAKIAARHRHEKTHLKKKIKSKIVFEDNHVFVVFSTVGINRFFLFARHDEDKIYSGFHAFFF